MNFLSRDLRFGALAMAWLLAALCVFGKTPKDNSVLMVVTDPLSRELACACVKGYGQRDYRKLAAHLEKAIGQRVSIEFSDDLAETLTLMGAGREVIAMGDQSLVAHGAKKAHLKCRPISEL